MQPIEFDGVNCVYAKDQKEYLPLPVHKTAAPEGEVISCWRLTFRERLRVLFSGKFWFSQWTFHQALQPQLPSVTKPDWIDWKAAEAEVEEGVRA